MLMRDNRVAMAAAPFVLRCSIPKGAASALRFPTLSVSQDERHHYGRKLQRDLRLQGIPTVGTFKCSHSHLTAYIYSRSLFCPQMKKRLRAEIYESFISMGQAAMLVQPEQYQEVRLRLANTMLCGAHARHVEMDLPPRPPKKIRTPRGMARQIFEIDEILAEEPPSKTHWRRYLVRWAGYQPEWEVWRLEGRGQPGDPLETWEPLSVVRHTEALERWNSSMQIA